MSVTAPSPHGIVERRLFILGHGVQLGVHGARRGTIDAAVDIIERHGRAIEFVLTLRHTRRQHRHRRILPALEGVAAADKRPFLGIERYTGSEQREIDAAAPNADTHP